MESQDPPEKETHVRSPVLKKKYSASNQRREAINISSPNLEMSHQSENSSTPLRRSPRKHVTTSNSAGPNILKDKVGSFRQLSRSASKLGDGGVNFKEMSSKRKYKSFLFIYVCIYRVSNRCWECAIGGSSGVHWGGSSKFDRGVGLSQYMGEHKGEA